MGNPSSVWTQLALPTSPIGSIPFVDLDGISIVTDVLNWRYTAEGAELSGTLAPYQLTIRGGLRVAATLNSLRGTTGTATKVAGRNVLASGNSSFVVTNVDYLTNSSIVSLTVESDDSTLKSLVVSARTDATFTVKGNAAATADVTFSWVITNVY